MSKPKFEEGDVVHVSKYGLQKTAHIHNYWNKNLMGIVREVTNTMLKIKQKGIRHPIWYRKEIWEPYS